MSNRYPYYKKVPKDFLANLQYRKDCIQAGSADIEVAKQFWVACSRDILFWINTFVWTHNPRNIHHGKRPLVPFITYPYQDDAFQKLEDAIGVDDVVIEKSRDMGASWVCILAFMHQWLFRHYRDFLLVSRRENLVDDRDNLDALMPKIEYVLKYMPGWLRPNYDYTYMKMINRDTGSTFKGESTQKNVGAGGRNTAVLLDEFARVEEDIKVLEATQDNTNSRILNSAPSYRGTNCAFYDMAQKPGIVKLRFHWSRHPEKAEGLYEEIGTGRQRSPWYDKQCDRSYSPAHIATQLDIDYLGASSQFFDADLIEKLKQSATRHPHVFQGEILYEYDTAQALRVMETKNGALRLWELPTEGAVWDGQYAIGVDVSYGKGTTNSTMAIVDKKSGIKIGEYVSAFKEPDVWAHDAVALAKWFNNAFVAWEENGPGTIFRENLVNLGYRNFFYRRNERKITKDTTPIPGWYATPQTKSQLLGEYQKALKSGTFLNYSHEALQECLQYVFTKAGNIEHGGATSATDPSGGKQNHGDRVIADALAFLGLSVRPAEEKKADDQVVHPSSLAYRREQYQRHKQAQGYW